MTKPTLSLNFTDIELINGTELNNSTTTFSISEFIVACFSIPITLLGLVGNGLVLWFLFFHIKKTPFTVYVLNLAVADFLLLLISIVVFLDIVCGVGKQLSKELIILLLLTVTYYAGLFILTAISVERCLSLMFPFWYRCKRPKYQSGITSAILWVVSILLTYIDYFGCNTKDFINSELKCTMMIISTSTLSLLIFFPAMVLSSLILFIKIWTKTWCQHSSKLYIVIVVTVIIFILFVVPPKLLSLLIYFKIIHEKNSFVVYTLSLFCSVVNSAANPFVYFFVGSMGKQGVGVSIQGALQKVFREDSNISPETAQDTEASEIKM
ncbi:proto-oncogene Mas-like [Microcaecilia unicolor]|uniref:Proto-oncogene Mas-like n=1 Tax=Microcaecilia unicolor TaxID=1415580 RepID=A0A6P7ZW12_9AMPH|nr:proto-oncogene Mas-like [Microcaecilia unicolor]